MNLKTLLSEKRNIKSFTSKYRKTKGKRMMLDYERRVNYEEQWQDLSRRQTLFFVENKG